MTEHFLIKWFGENISQLFVSTNMPEINISFGNMITDEMMSHLDVLGSGMLHMIVCNLNNTFTVTQQRYF